MKSAKVAWVTGSSGFIGRNVVSELRSAGYETICFSNFACDCDKDKQLDWQRYPMDFSDPGDIKKQVDDLGLPDIFIHLAWADMTKPESDRHLTENVKAGKTLVETLFSSGLEKFLFVGSMNEYGGRTGSLSEYMDPEGRLTQYAKGKIEVAKFGFRQAEKYSKIFLHARPFYVYGPGQRQGSLVNDLYNAFCNRTNVSLSPCEHYRDYIHVSEAAKGLRLITKLGSSYTVNLGSGSVVKVKDFVLLFWKMLGGDIEQLHFGSRQVGKDEPEQPRSYADLSLLRKLTCWEPELSLENGVRMTVEAMERSRLHENSGSAT